MIRARLLVLLSDGCHSLLWLLEGFNERERDNVTPELDSLRRAGLVKIIENNSGHGFGLLDVWGMA